jgi:hypothetical protein
LIEFKIELKILSLKLNFTNKSCRTKLLEYNITCLKIFEFFYKFLSIFKADRKDPRKKRRLAIGSLVGLNRGTARRRSNFSEEAHRQRGGSGGKGSGTHGGLGGWQEPKKEGAEMVVRRRTEPARRGSEAAAVFRWTECRKAMGKWPGSFYA